MTDRNPIPLPSDAERRRAIQTIAARGLQKKTPVWRRLSLGVLFFGVRDSLILAGLLFLGGLGCAVLTARYLSNCPSPFYAPGDPMAIFSGLPPAGTAPLVVLTAPLLYAALQALTTWQDRLQGTLEWKQSCLITPDVLLALRTAIFGALSAALCAPVNYLLWQLTGRQAAFLWMLGASLACLFLYAALTLFLYPDPRRSNLGLPALWLLLGLVLAQFKISALLLLRTPALVFFLLAAAALSFFLYRLRRILLASQQGGLSYGTVR